MVTLHSYAKLNRSLLVYPPLLSGYHPIQSVFQTISLADILTIQTMPKGEFVLECSDLSVPTDEVNSIVKVYEYFEARLDQGFEIFLEKHIPMGAGMGGGSSNAACFLTFLNEHFLKMPVEALKKESVRFGADVAFFIEGGRAFVGGIGDEVSALEFTSMEHYVVLYPNTHAETAAVYTAFDQFLQDENMPLLQKNDVIEQHMGRNDLFLPALSFYPAIQEVVDWGNDVDAPPLMTGSGSTLYWVFSDELSSQHFAERVRSKFPEYRLFLASTI